MHSVFRTFDYSLASFFFPRRAFGWSSAALESFFFEGREVGLPEAGLPEADDFDDFFGFSSFVALASDASRFLPLLKKRRPLFFCSFFSSGCASLDSLPSNSISAIWAPSPLRTA